MFTSEHEILTISGISKVKDISIGSKIYNFNMKNKSIDTDQISSISESIYNGYIYDIGTYIGQGSFSVTDDHVFILKNKNSDIIKITAEELFNKYDRLDEVDGYISLFNFPKISKYRDIERSDEIKLIKELPNIYNDNKKDIMLTCMSMFGYYTTYYYVNYDDNLDEDFYKIKAWRKNTNIEKRFVSRRKYEGKIYKVSTKKNNNLFAGKKDIENNKNTFLIIGN
jgi:hypothetical protein